MHWHSRRGITDNHWNCIFKAMLYLPVDARPDAMSLISNLYEQHGSAIQKSCEQGQTNVVGFVFDQAPHLKEKVVAGWMEILRSGNTHQNLSGRRYVVKSNAKAWGIMDDSPIFKECMAANMRRTLHLPAHFILPEDNVLEYYQRNSTIKFIQFVLDQSTELRDAIFNAWIAELRSEDIDKVTSLVELIEEHAEELGIADESIDNPNKPNPYQEAIAAGIRITNKDDVDSPYHFHSKLKEKRAETVTIPMLWETMEGMRFCTNPAFLPSLSQLLVKARDLPETSAFFSDMVNHLRTQAAQSPEFCDRVHKQTGFSWSEINAGALGGSHLQHLLKVDASYETVSSTRVKFIRIMDTLKKIVRQTSWIARCLFSLCSLQSNIAKWAKIKEYEPIIQQCKAATHSLK